MLHLEVHIEVLNHTQLSRLRMFNLVCILCCGCFNLFCNMWACVCEGVLTIVWFVLVIYVLVLTVFLYCFVYVYLFLFFTSARTTTTE